MAGARAVLRSGARVKNFQRNNETLFLHLATTWLGCRLALMGGTPLVKQHVPVTNFETLGHAMLGMLDYAWEMKLVCKEWKESL